MNGNNAAGKLNRPQTDLDKFAINLDALLERVELTLKRLENMLAKIIATDSEIVITEINRLFNRAGNEYDEALRANAANNRPHAEQHLLAALTISEEAIDRASKLLGADARERFTAVEAYMTVQEPSDLAKFKLACARHLMNCSSKTTVWNRALTSLQIIEYLIQGHAIAFCEARDRGQKTENDSPAHGPGNKHDTIRLFAT